MTGAFWDSSSLVPLCVIEPTTHIGSVLAAQYEFVAWWGTYVEIRSALSRRYRTGELDLISRHAALGRLAILSQIWSEITPGDDLRELAAELMDKYPLRAADSLQLAAALTWCSGKASGRVFISGDTRLCEAATAVGFRVILTGS